MSARERKMHEYRLRLETEAAHAEQHDPDDAPDEESARATRMENQALWVDLQIREAIRRGDFDDLPGAGKPIRGDDAPHDPDWWLKSLIERERITGVLPPALALRTENARLDGVLDDEATPAGVRRVLEDFNARIIEARRQLQGGPPVITPLRDIDQELYAWQQRRATRLTAAREGDERTSSATTPLPWWRRLLDRLRIRVARRVSVD